jgi:hypothetical protein
LDTFLPFICGDKNSLIFCLTEFVNFVNLVYKQVGHNLYVKKIKLGHDCFLVRYKLWAGWEKNKPLATLSNTSCARDEKKPKELFSQTGGYMVSTRHDGGYEVGSDRKGKVGPRRVQAAGTRAVGEKSITFLAETLPKLRFL